MKKIVVIVSFLFSSVLMAEDIYNLKFDNITGKLINPDSQYLNTGLKDQEQGKIDSAIDNFTKSAEFGNYLAMSMIAYHHLSNKNYIESMAWLQLIDVNKFKRKDHKDNTGKMIKELKAYLMTDEMLKVGLRHAELKKSYGALPTFQKRKDWKKRIKTPGSMTKFGIPPSLLLELESGIQIDAETVRSEVDDFVYNHEFSGQDAFVILKEGRLIQQ